MKKMIAGILLLLGSVAAANATNYTPVGPQTNVSVADVLNGGWSMVYSAPMATSIGSDPANSIMSAYTNTLVMLAGRVTGSDTFTLLAEAPYADVFYQTHNNVYNPALDSYTNTTHNANGSEWYYTPNFSWGFVPGGTQVSLDIADTIYPSPMSLSIHTVTYTGGFRIGNVWGLNNNSDWEKDILVFTGANTGAAPVPEPGTLMLLGAGLASLALVRRRARK